ncbi:hypothetical protein [Thermohalobacter berrensis]|uniref:Uncharacterized protein n=1 Tax=Thermohalobacter berrensis TaxID=99594 RepID=A0A419T7L9_9FIRM|nr:hypothetical protein [Thermohalobacter berrensis]RKD33429.1 hypothetical protein BET03_09250 [Thermohalobacter berrensis]
MNKRLKVFILFLTIIVGFTYYIQYKNKIKVKEKLENKYDYSLEKKETAKKVLEAYQNYEI